MVLSALLPLLLSTTSVSFADDAVPPLGPVASLSQASQHEAKPAGDGEGKKNGKKGGKGGKGGKKGGHKEEGQKIAAAEFSNSGRTTKKGTLILSPLLAPSSYAVSDKVMVLVPIVPQLTGPKLGARYSFMNKKQKDLAVEPFASSDWQFASVSAGANLRYTMEMGKNRLNLAAGAGFSTTLDTVETVAASGSSVGADDIPSSGLTSTNLEIGYDLALHGGYRPLPGPAGLTLCGGRGQLEPVFLGELPPQPGRGRLRRRQRGGERAQRPRPRSGGAQRDAAADRRAVVEVLSHALQRFWRAGRSGYPCRWRCPMKIKTSVKSGDAQGPGEGGLW